MAALGGWRARALRVGLCAGLVLAARPAAAQDGGDEPQLAALDVLRAEVASQIQLLAFDLLDEVVFGWTQQPVFATDTPVVLAGVTVPVGFGTGLEALIENHFASLVVRNPSTRLVLAHCPMCTATIVRSGKQGTVLSRGVDAPEALAQAGGLAGCRHALFIDFEAEGAALVLRVRITSLEPSLPIVYARTLSSAAATPALLREGDHLKSAAEARREYLEALQNSGAFAVPMRVTVRRYAARDQDTGTTLSVAPFVWLLAGVETAFTQSRAWTASFSLGYTWSPDTHYGWLAEARLSRLVSGLTRSLTQPDLYLFLGASAISIYGQDALLFRNRLPTMAEMLNTVSGDDPRSTFAAWQLGLQLRVKNRINAALFLETLPFVGDAPSLDSYLDFGFVEFQTFGAEVGFCF